ncbi:MAG: endonuclease domain-containing protein [Chloroflexi bacterium]|nr:endonuclease domain-containing protein [Chloroflexota bacterium]
MDTYRGGESRVQHLKVVRQLRMTQTDAERIVWQRIRAGQLEGFKFRRQHEYGGYVLDLYCARAKLAVELDGGQHLTTEGLAQDAQRTRFLERNGIRVLRFTNTQVLAEIDQTLEAVLRALRS